MKVTVSSTSMMKPILYSELMSSANKAHPQRVLGLLEQTHKDRDHEPLVVYARPNQLQKTPCTVQWTSFMQIQDKQAQWCVAVFGFEFDGKNTWYQIWNLDNNESSWVMHNSGIDYQPYAIMAMDALVTLLPDWNGELHWNLTPPQMSDNANPNNENKHQRQSRSFSRAHGQYDVQISDAATCSNGKLWFLVTIQDDKALEKSEKLEQLRTGWITH